MEQDLKRTRLQRCRWEWSLAASNFSLDSAEKWNGQRNLGVVSKISMKRISHNEAIFAGVGTWAEWDCKTNFPINSFAENRRNPVY